jgi:Tol biopolymer transport system component
MTTISLKAGAALAVAGAAAVLTLGGGAPATATTPGADGFVLFAKDVGGYQLFRVRPDGSGERRLTRVKGDAVHPDWSPDGRRIAVEVDHRNEKPQICSIALMNADGSGLTDLGAGSGCDYQPSFTPDGDQILFGHFDPEAETERLMIMDADGSGRRELDLPWKRGVDDPNSSPDGRWITFVRIKELEKRQAIFRVHPDGSGLKRLTPFRWEVAIKHDWSPDGKLIVLTTNADFVRPDASANMVTIRPSGKLVTRVTRFKGGDENAFAGSFSPSGKRIVFRHEDGEKAGLASVDLKGRHLRQITPLGPQPPRFIDWGTHR